MNSFYFKNGLVIVFILLSNLGFGQSKEIKIKFIGNCGFHMTDGINNFYIDFPYKSGAHNYMKYDDKEIEEVKNKFIFIFTHKHSDHYSKKIVKRYNGQKFGPWNISKLVKLHESIPNFEIKAFKTKHKVFGISFKHYSYLIKWHNKKIYISGDTGDLDDLAKIKNVEWTFLNPWIYRNANNTKLVIDTKNIGIYHLYPNQEIDVNNPENHFLLKNQGEVINIPY